MKSLGVKFSDKTDLQIKDLASVVDMPNSKIARAAMQIGLMQLKNAAVKDCDTAKSFIAIEDAKSRH
ncbi:hypothetical protein [Pseudoalteromonas phage PS_L5]|nr:hypothetical protein [Pseudoalteromonas phage PS_L5]|tara:strand:- start:29816 stop:30016 length:201 start_codon:yes stop_codon:yes gene_type:complete